MSAAVLFYRYNLGAPEDSGWALKGDASDSGHDRVFMISDMQCFADSSGRGFGDGGYSSSPVPVPDGTKVYGVNLGGYAKTAIDSRIKNRFEFAGLTDSVFQQILALEAGFAEKWPWAV